MIESTKEEEQQQLQHQQHQSQSWNIFSYAFSCFKDCWIPKIDIASHELIALREDRRRINAEIVQDELQLSETKNEHKKLVLKMLKLGNENAFMEERLNCARIIRTYEQSSKAKKDQIFELDKFINPIDELIFKGELVKRQETIFKGLSFQGITAAKIEELQKKVRKATNKTKELITTEKVMQQKDEQDLAAESDVLTNNNDDSNSNEENYFKKAEAQIIKELRKSQRKRRSKNKQQQEEEEEEEEEEDEEEEQKQHLYEDEKEEEEEEEEKEEDDEMHEIIISPATQNKKQLNSILDY
jgi:hypothetical protein